MSDQTQSDKGAGRGRGRWTERGAQAAQQGDIEDLKALVAEMGVRLDALEAGEGAGTDTGDDGATGTPV